MDYVAKGLAAGVFGIVIAAFVAPGAAQAFETRTTASAELQLASHKFAGHRYGGHRFGRYGHGRGAFYGSRRYGSGFYRHGRHFGPSKYYGKGYYGGRRFHGGYGKFRRGGVGVKISPYGVYKGY